MYQVYEKKFGVACLSAPTMPGGCSGKGTEAWNDIYGDNIYLILLEWVQWRI